MNNGTAFVTGAATGIGKALVEKLDREGWRCFAGYNRQPPDRLLKACGETTRAVHCNVADEASVRAALSGIQDSLDGGALDLLVNNAATTGGAGGGVECVDIDRFKALFEVNFWGPLRIVQGALPLLRRSERARIINVGSASRYLTIPLGCSYPVTKAALAKLTDALRVEMKPFGIEVTFLDPGGVKTPMMDITEEQKAELWASFPDELLDSYQAHFKFPGDAIEATFPLWTAEEFADRMYREVVTDTRLKPSYLLGPGVWVLPLMQRTMPESMLEKVFERMFRV
ncbi:MAG TPA: SDR family NAD(P)-dependent oxidoreductase [Polyangiales bacterium]|nr:SDR family NAD(P)-dependent oxidoreductase [Polyangiales bacterium]